MYFLTFFDSRFRRSLERIENEAAAMGFEDVFAWDESHLGAEFLRQPGYLQAA